VLQPWFASVPEAGSAAAVAVVGLIMIMSGRLGASVFCPAVDCVCGSYDVCSLPIIADCHAGQNSKHMGCLSRHASLHCTVYKHLLLQMYAMPVFDMAEDLCRRKNIKNKLFTRVFVRSLFVVFTAFVGISLPFFGGNKSVTCLP